MLFSSKGCSPLKAFYHLVLLWFSCTRREIIAGRVSSSLSSIIAVFDPASSLFPLHRNTGVSISTKSMVYAFIRLGSLIYAQCPTSFLYPIFLMDILLIEFCAEVGTAILRLRGLRHTNRYILSVSLINSIG